MVYMRNVSFRLMLCTTERIEMKSHRWRINGQSQEYTYTHCSLLKEHSFKGRKSPSDYGLDARKILYVDAGIIGLLDTGIR